MPDSVSSPLARPSLSPYPTPLEADRQADPGGHGHADCTFEEHARAFLGTPEGVSATRRPQPMEPFDPIEEVVSSEVQHSILEKTVGLVSSTVAHGLETAGPALAIFEYLLAGAEHDFERGDRENQIYHHDRLRGFIAGFEGRSNAPEARRESELHPGYRDGLAAFELVLARQPAALVDHLRAHVREAATSGQDAVLLGRDRGDAFDRRYESDLVFRHAVDFERREQARDPAAFAAKRSAAEERARQVENARHSLPVRP